MRCGLEHCIRLIFIIRHMSLVSIIVPCRNYGSLLPEALNSVLAQTHADWECLVVDDGSTDSTPTVAGQYAALDPRFRYLPQAHAGASAARNHGLRAAKGQFVQFLDADDLLPPRKLEVQLAFLTTHPEVDIVYGSVRYFRHGEPAELSRSFNMLDTTDWFVPLHGTGAPVLRPLLVENRIVIHAPLLRWSVFEAGGHFSERLGAVEDWEFWLRCAARGQVFEYHDTPETQTLVRVHPLSTSQDRTRVVANVERLRVHLKPLLSTLGDSNLLALNQKLLNEIRLENAGYYMEHGDFRRGLLGFARLAFETGHYWSSAKDVGYWLRHYLRKRIKKNEI
jgi:glycosyltransferase involved in cell wall biosynthesis